MEQIGAKCSMKRLKQIEESKKMISDAFIRLLQDKTMDEISISQITIEAQIGRNTFYNHFQKKEDILDYLMQGLLKELQEKLAQKASPSIRDLLLWRFSLLKENPLLAVLHSNDDIKQLFFRFRDNKFSLFNFPAKKDIYKREFVQGGLDYVTSRWIVGGMKESPQIMADKILSLISQ